MTSPLVFAVITPIIPLFLYHQPLISCPALLRGTLALVLLIFPHDAPPSVVTVHGVGGRPLTHGDLMALLGLEMRN